MRLDIGLVAGWVIGQNRATQNARLAVDSSGRYTNEDVTTKSRQDNAGIMQVIS